MSVNDRQAYKGLFINLDRSPDRRVKMESQLRKFNLQHRYSRFPAVDGQTLARTPGNITAAEYACFRSHCGALESAKAELGTIHILEDDVILSPQIEQIVGAFDSSGLLDPYDLIFTDTFVDSDPWLLREFKQQFDLRSSQPLKLSLLDFGQSYRCTTPSYLVPARSFVKVLDVMRRGLINPSLPIDLFLRQEAQLGRLRLGCIFPFVTSVELGDADRTTITDRSTTAELSKEVMALLRYSFFIGRDLKSIPPTLLEKLHRPNNDDHEALISAVLGFVMFSNDFSKF
jgi:GR25 family glycosyltransferase involved in LPS biosynthesis